MSQVKRYVTTCDCMSEAAWGDYVRHSDYAALEAECDRLRGALHRASKAESRPELLQIIYAALSAKP